MLHQYPYRALLTLVPTFASLDNCCYPSQRVLSGMRLWHAFYVDLSFEAGFAPLSHGLSTGSRPREGGARTEAQIADTFNAVIDEVAHPWRVLWQRSESYTV